MSDTQQGARSQGRRRGGRPKAGPPAGSTTDTAPAAAVKATDVKILVSDAVMSDLAEVKKGLSEALEYVISAERDANNGRETRWVSYWTSDLPTQLPQLAERITAMLERLKAQD